MISTHIRCSSRLRSFAPFLFANSTRQMLLWLCLLGGVGIGFARQTGWHIPSLMHGIAPPSTPLPSPAVQAGSSGSVLVFPYYHSDPTTGKDTTLTIFNQGGQAALVHLFFMSGATCSQADTFITVAANSSVTLSAAQYDPTLIGWLLAVAVDASGNPIANNNLRGTATLNDGDYIGSYDAKALQALSASPATNNNDGTATLNFNGSGYEQVPTRMSTLVQSVADAPGQKVITVGLQGNVATTATGAKQVGNGLVTRTSDTQTFSFTDFLLNACQASATISANNPRILSSFGVVIPSGDTATFSFNIGAGFGLLLTPKTAPNSGVKYITATTPVSTTLTIPVYAPTSAANPPVALPKTGSVLVFPYYTSDLMGRDTTLNISNTGSQTVALHVFYINGATCTQTDQYLIMSPNFCTSFTASSADPTTTGWLLVVAVDANGVPMQYNNLAGQAVVSDGNYQGFYDAVAFPALSATPATSNPNGTATLNFDGIGYQKVPNQLTPFLQNPQLVPAQKVVTVGLQGDVGVAMVSGAGQTGTGLVRGAGGGTPGSFTKFLIGGCQAWGFVSNASPRVPGGLGSLIPSGTLGATTFNIGAGVGLLMTPVAGNGSGISPLPVTDFTNSTLTIPVFAPPQTPGGNGPPIIGTITTQPQDQGTNEMGIVTFSTAVTGNQTVQWQVSTDGGITFHDLPGETNLTLTVANVSLPMSGNLYRAVLTFPCNVLATRTAKLTVLPFMINLLDPFVCFSKDTLTIHAELGNPNNINNPFTLTTIVDTRVTVVPNACISTVGTCTTSPTGISVTGTLAPFQRMAVDYKVMLKPGVVNPPNLCVTSNATLQFGGSASILECESLNCPGTPVIVHDQRAGSVLVFPYYISQAAQQKDTRLTISNVGDNQVIAHVFFIDGKTCHQSDQFLCLTPNASFSFRTSEFDPETTGWLLAVAVDDQGRPIRNNVLIGNAFVRDGDYVDNYAAETFWAQSNALASINPDSTATLYFDGGSYDLLVNQLSTEIQSPLDAPGQRLVTVGMSGDLSRSQLTGAAQVGTATIYNGNEKPFGSFNSLLTGNCQAIATISTTNPRVPFGMSQMIPPGQVGSLTFNVGAGVGLVMTPRTAQWRGIRGLHNMNYIAGSMTIPMYRPTC